MVSETATRETMLKDSLLLFLHLHLPYSRFAGDWPSGEGWYFNSLLSCYIPLFWNLSGMSEEGRRDLITISVSPVGIEQLRDTYLIENFYRFLDHRAHLFMQDIEGFHSKGDSAGEAIARGYLAWVTEVKRIFLKEINSDIVALIKELYDKGVVELAVSAMTHPYLPLLVDERRRKYQIALACDYFEKTFGRRAKGFWLPWTGYVDGVEEVIREAGCEYTILSEQGLTTDASDREESRLQGQVRAVEPEIIDRGEGNGGHPSAHPLLLQRREIKDEPFVLLTANEGLSKMLSSPDVGYPGDYRYREFHKFNSDTRFRYWRITGKEVELKDKGYYIPEDAKRAVSGHVAHFLSLAESWSRSHRETCDRGDGALVVPIEGELLGHRWYEGVEWLISLLHQTELNPLVGLRTAASYLSYVEKEAGGVESFLMNLQPAKPASADGGGAVSGWWGEKIRWVNQESQSLYREIFSFLESPRFSVILRGIEEGKELPQKLVPFLDQMMRELLLTEAGDWPYLIINERAVEYAEDRFRIHHKRATMLLTISKGYTVRREDERYLEEVRSSDSLFPELSFASFLEKGRTE